VACELVSALNKLDCKGIVTNSDDTTIETLKEAVPDFDHGSSQSMPSLKHIILTGSNKTSMTGAHSYNDLIKQGEARKTQQQDILRECQASVNPDSPLAIILTSGSTDEPQPVTLTNFGVLNTILSHLNYFESSFLHPCGTQAMFHISTGLWTLLVVAVKKCTVVVPSATYDAASAMRAIHEEKCSSLIVSPILFRDILADPHRSKYDLSSLKCVGIGAAPLRPTFLRKIEKELSIGPVFQAYGLTESGCLLTASFHSKDDRRYTSIGQCMPHIELKLVDENGRTVPIGSQGEVWARGYSIMSGYFKDSERTAEVITDAGWLRTGDLATMDQDGYLFFVGRKKYIIITQTGRNVSPTEIEHAIEDHDSVNEAHVFSIPDPRVEEVICAFVKLNSGMQCEVNELKEFLGTKLTDYKVPEHIHFVDEFSRTSLGKVAKFKLAEEMKKLLKQ
jgi:fatty-acyl-CoA synthase